MSVLDKLKKNTTINDTAMLKESPLFQKKDMVQTPVPMLNVAFSGMVDGGFCSGLTMFAGPSKSFKTLFTLICANAYMHKYPKSAFLFYVSEFGSPLSYFEALGMDMDRIITTPLTDVEKLKFDVINQYENLDRGDRVITGIDSLGMLASIKELEDAKDAKSVQDMSRAKSFKSFWRMVTPYLTIKDLPMIAVNHTYKEIGTMYPKDIVGGGTGGYLAADNIYIMGRQQAKEGSGENAEHVGYKFIINVEKSRYVREKSKIPITVRFDGGVSVYSGLFDIAFELGYITQEKKGWYQTSTMKSSFREADADGAEFWEPILEKKDFRDAIKNKYMLTEAELLNAKPVEIMDDE